MAKQNKPTVKHESGVTGADEVAETKAIKNWLWITDRPLARRKGNNDLSEPRAK